MARTVSFAFDHDNIHWTRLPPPPDELLVQQMRKRYWREHAVKPDVYLCEFICSKRVEVRNRRIEFITSQVGVCNERPFTGREKPWKRNIRLQAQRRDEQSGLARYS